MTNMITVRNRLAGGEEESPKYSIPRSLVGRVRALEDW